MDHERRWILPKKQDARLQRQHGTKQGGIHQLPLAGAFAVVQRGTHRIGNEHAGRHICRREIPVDFGLLLPPVHDAANALHHHVEAGHVFEWPMRSIASVGHINQSGVVFTQRLIAKAVFISRTRTHILHQYIAPCDEVADDGLPFRGFQIDDHVAFIAIDAHEKMGFALLKRRA